MPRAGRAIAGIWRWPSWRGPDDPGIDDRGLESASKPWLVNFKVRLFSVTVLTTCSEAPEGISASTSRVMVTLAPTIPVRWAMTSSATRPASRPRRVASRVTVPWTSWACALGLGRRSRRYGPRPGIGPGPGPVPVVLDPPPPVTWGPGPTTMSTLAASASSWGGDGALDEQAGRVGVDEGDVLAASQAAVAAGGLVEAVGEGEAFFFPGQQTGSVADGADQDVGVLEPGEVDVASEVLGELLDGDVTVIAQRGTRSSSILRLEPA